MVETTGVKIWNKQSGGISPGVIISSWDGFQAELSLAVPDVHVDLQVSGRDLFDALQQVRLRLEPLGWYTLCNGARLDCYPSGMARDMGGAAAVYG